MRVLATKAELDALPDWIIEFAIVGWGRRFAWGSSGGWSPDRLSSVTQIKNMRQITGRFADRLQEALQSPGVVEHNISLLWSDEPKFVEATVFADPQIRIAHALMLAWNDGSILAQCVVCGSLMQPGKGRVAQACSGACRVKYHRSDEYLRERADDAAVELQQEHLEHHGEPEEEDHD